MKDIALKIIDLLKLKRVTYGDVRIVLRKLENIKVKNEVPLVVTTSDDCGFGVRVFIDGGWGFSSSSDFKIGNIEKVVNQAISIAKASGSVNKNKFQFSELDPIEGAYITPHQINPLNVSLEEKINLLVNATSKMKKYVLVKIRQGFMRIFIDEKIFANTEDSIIHQKVMTCGGGIQATAIGKDEYQVRAYPNSFEGNFATGGYEFIESLQLDENSERIGQEAEEILKAPQCPSGIMDIIIDSSQLALQVHESIGHPIELDRVFGTEASYAGTSFIEPAMMNNLRYGSGIVNVYADATVTGALGSFGYDDEGVPAQRIPIIQNGIFKNFLSSRETAPLITKKSNGTMRADGWQNIPLIRMTNINLEPGEWDLEDLISDTKNGLYLETNSSWSIDDKRINFQFATELAKEIKNGKLGKIYKNPTYTGITTKFWNSCDAICSEKYWKKWGTPNCGKGEPPQTMYVGHCTSPARFRNVYVGVMK